MIISPRLFFASIKTATLIALCLAVTPLYADSLNVVKNRVTWSSANETIPTLGNDGGDLVVYTSYVITSMGAPVQADIYYQRLLAGQADGPPVQVTSTLTDDQLNDVSGDYIVYTSYDTVDSATGSIMVYQISAPTQPPRVIGSASFIFEPKIHGNYVVWRQGASMSAQVMIFDLTASTGTASPLTGSSTPTFDVEIGDRFAVWSELNGDYDIAGFDLATGQRLVITGTGATNERQPSTSGSWVVWQAQDKDSLSRRIEAYDLDAAPTDPNAFRSVVDDGASNSRPSIDGDLITYESDATGNYDVYVYRLSTAETFVVTTDLENQYLNDVFGNLVSYVQMNQNAPPAFDEDLYVANLTFISPNSPPIADAGADQTMYLGESTDLQGSATDPDGDPITDWLWRIVSQPQGSAPNFYPPTSPTPNFSPDMLGDYVFALSVSDGIAMSTEDFVTVTVALNLPPVAAIAADVTTGPAPLTVNFDGSGSFDPEGGALTVGWTFNDGSPPSTALSPTHVFTAPSSYVVVLTVIDDWGQAGEDTITITVLPALNNPPTLAPTATPTGGDAPLTVQFTANAADPDGDVLTYAWDFGDPASLDNMSTLADPIHVYQDAGTYAAGLTVSDGALDTTASATVVVTAPPVNTAPVAAAGPDQVVVEINTLVTLDGTQSYDDDGDTFAYEWRMLTTPPSSAAFLSDLYVAKPTFTADINGTYEAELTVTDPFGASDTDTVVVSFNNIVPVADAGGNQSVVTGDLVRMDGGNSADANLDPLTFAWTLDAKPTLSTAGLAGADTSIATFTADLAGTYEVSLLVRDGLSQSAPDTVTITAVSGQGIVTDALHNLMRTVNGLSSGVFKNRNMQNTLTNKINAVISMVEQGLYQDALNKMENDILKKTDGCGTAPDKNDWIRTCSEQNGVQSLTMEVIDLLRGLI